MGTELLPGCAGPGDMPSGRDVAASHESLLWRHIRVSCQTPDPSVQVGPVHPAWRVQVDDYVAARASHGACNVSGESPAPGLIRVAGLPGSPCSAGPRGAMAEGGRGLAEDLWQWLYQMFHLL